MEKFLCTHCSHRFESDAQENLSCPNCFWTTSVTRQENSGAVPPAVSAKESDLPGKDERPHPWLWAGSVFFIVLLAAFAIFSSRYFRKQDEILHTLEVQNSEIISKEAPELALTAEERAVLERSVSLQGPAPLLSEQEKESLAPKFSFRTRGSRGIPTPPWTEKDFDQFLAGRQSQFQIPLDRSYRRKLQARFKNHYLPAAQAFEGGDFQKARDEWIRSLAFPVYQGNPAKHRGVVLTLLRPFINDTLSKIGSMNASLVGKDLYASEEKLQASYNQLHELLRKESWEEANAKILELMKELEAVEKSPPTAEPPPLPAEIASVDPDIRNILLEQTAPSQSSHPDWDRLRQELAAKERLVQNRLPEGLENVKRQYDRARALIQEGRWQAAKDLLSRIQFPEPFAEDVRAKSQVIDRLLSGVSLDSGKKSE